MTRASYSRRVDKSTSSDLSKGSGRRPPLARLPAERQLAGFTPPLLFMVVLFACKGGTQLVSECTSDDQCSTNFHCGISGLYKGKCLCSNDQACPQDAGPSFCNPAGQCQTKVGCLSNADCGGQSVCDTKLGLCVPPGSCGADPDCTLGSVCAADPATPAQTTCMPGCHSNGDCPLGQPCVCASGAECACPPTDGGFLDPARYDRTQCEIGTCRADTCANDTSLCPYNQNCVGSDGGSSTCQPDPRLGVLCQNCMGSVAGQACGLPGSQGANFCLIDPHASNLFCGVDCSQGQSCPSGYECDDIIILTQNLCSTNQDCAPSKIACDPQIDAGICPSDSRCAGSGASGACAGYCVIGEGNPQGFCTCVTDSDCPKDVCDTTSRRCSISQQPCDPSSPATCGSIISCVDFAGERGCFIGRNCAPSQGLHCPLNAPK